MISTVMRRRICIISVFKLFGVMLVIIGGAISACVLNMRAKISLTHTEAMISFLRFVKVRVDCYAMPIDRILSDCDESIYEGLGYTDAKKPEDLAALAKHCTSLRGDIKDIMTKFASEFGKSYREEQVKLCDRYIDEMLMLRSDISARLPMQKKLNSTLCISGAMAIVILLI